MSRSKCARCGQPGHWARECKNEPDERGRRRMTTQNMYMIGDTHDTEIVENEESNVQNTTDFVLSNFAAADAEVLIGLSVSPGFALVDTGAQHGVIGSKAYDQVVERLAVHGLKPRIVETLKLQASGVGGTTSFQKSAQVPIAIAGASGLLTVHVIDQDIPLLLPVEFCKKLGMILNLPELQIRWKNINRHSDIHEIPGCGHLAVEII